MSGTTAGRVTGGRRQLLGARPSPDVRALLFLVVLCGGVFAVYLALGLTFYEDDIQNYYYPVLVHLLGSLARLELPLWTPTMFGGFPFLADGSAGTFYPLMWTALLVPREAAIVWLVGLRTVLGAVFFYAFARALGMSALGATLAAVVYSFCGYNVGRWIHLSVAHSTLTLPLALWAVEKAHRARGKRPWLWLILAGLAAALLWLGVHPQGALISSTLLVLYAAFRELAGEGDLSFARRLGRLAVGGLVVGLIVVGLSAVQIVPMAELGRFSVRAQGISYSFATSYALPRYNLATFFWPYAFLAPDGFDWGLTNRWETALYVGVLPLALAAIALFTRRDRHALFWGALAFFALWLALGIYVPVNLHYWLSQLPGFSIFRVPARFLLLTNLALAVLAGYGLDRLRRAEGQASLGRALTPIALALAGVTGVGLAFAALVALRPLRVVGVLWPHYIHWPRVATWNPDHVFPALQATWNLGNPRFLLATAMIALSAALLLGWRFRPGWRRAEIIVGLAVLDLVLFAGAFWHAIPAGQLGQPNGPVARAVAELATSERVFSQKWSPTAPNRLIAFGVRDVSTYGPLGSHRHNEYLQLAQYGGNRLLDIMGVRWLVAPLDVALPQETRGVRYDKFQPLLVARGARNGAGDPVTYRLEAPFSGKGVRLVGRLNGAASLPQGSTAVEIRLRGEGREVVLPLRAGVDLSDANALRSDLRGRLAHQTLPVVDAATGIDPGGGTYERLYFLADVQSVEAPLAISELEIRVVAPRVGLEVYGLGLLDADGKILPADRLTDSRFVQRARDERARLLEQLAPLPRAFLVGEAKTMPANSRLLQSLADEVTDPTSVVYLEEPVDPALYGGLGPVGTVRLVGESDTELRYAVDTPRPALLFTSEMYYPGWEATVGGQPATIYRADYLFRALVVPAGQYEVRMTFVPKSVYLGMGITGATLLLMFGLALWLWRGVKRDLPVPAIRQDG